jgi:hypothetical protein
MTWCGIQKPYLPRSGVARGDAVGGRQGGVHVLEDEREALGQVGVQRPPANPGSGVSRYWSGD